MKKFIYSISLGLLTCGSSLVAAQNLSSSIMYDHEGRFMHSMREDKLKVTDVQARLSDYFNLPFNHSFVLKSSHISPLTGLQTLKYEQYVNGYKVQNAQVLVRAQNGVVTSINGRILPHSSKAVDLNVLVSAEEVVTQLKASQGILKVIYSEPIELVILHDNDQNAQLVYKLRMDATHTNFKMSFNIYYINAQTGQLIKSVPQNSFTDVTGTAQTFYSGDKTITSDLTDGVYTLKDNERNILTLNASGQLPDLAETATVIYPEATNYTNASENWLKQNNFVKIQLDAVENPFIIENIGVSFTTFRGNRLITKVEKLIGGTYVEVARKEELAIEYDLSLPYNVNNLNVILNEDDQLRVTIVKDSFMIDFSTFSIVSVIEYTDDKIEFYPVDLSLGTHTWTNGGNTGNYQVEFIANPALDAHWGIEMAHDFYKLNFDRASFDGEGTLVINYYNGVENLYGTQNNAAALPAPYNAMVYGTGDEEYNPFVILDVTGHEYSHLVVFASSNLEYSGESGALNESFADMMGIAIEDYAYEEGTTWKIGDGLHANPTVAIRNMANPNEMGLGGVRQPDTYLGTYWAPTGSTDPDNGGVHINSGVGNFWFYLLSQGGTGTNDNGDAYNVSAIGIEKAQKIAYIAFTDYLISTSNYMDAFNATKEVAIDLYGEGSAEYNSVVEAWRAVGIPRPTSIGHSPNWVTECSIYPNPSQGQITINILDGQQYHLNVYNVLGQNVFSKASIQGIEHLELTQLNQGVYTFELINEQGARQTHKVTIVK